MIQFHNKINHNGGDEDLIIWVNIEPLCCVCETTVRLCINDTFILKKQWFHLSMRNTKQFYLLNIQLFLSICLWYS